MHDLLYLLLAVLIVFLIAIFSLAVLLVSVFVAKVNHFLRDVINIIER